MSPFTYPHADVDPEEFAALLHEKLEEVRQLRLSEASPETSYPPRLWALASLIGNGWPELAPHIGEDLRTSMLLTKNDDVIDPKFQPVVSETT